MRWLGYNNARCVNGWMRCKKSHKTAVHHKMEMAYNECLNTFLGVVLTRDFFFFFLRIKFFLFLLWYDFSYIKWKCEKDTSADKKNKTKQNLPVVKMLCSVCVCVCVCRGVGREAGSGFNLQTVAVCVPALWACVRYLCHQLCFSELSSVSLASWTKRPTLHPMQITSPLHPMRITAQCLQRCSFLNHSRRRL